MIRIFVLVLLVTTSCQKKIITSHLSKEEFWKAKDRRLNVQGKLSHSFLSPALCWDKRCLYQINRKANQGVKFKGYKKGGPPPKLRIKEDSPKKVLPNTRSYDVGKKYVIKNLKFNHNQSTILSSSYDELNKLSAYLGTNEFDVEIHGHTDSSGTEEYNFRLSLARAYAVKEFLIDNGIMSDRIHIYGHGETMPLIDENSEGAFEVNRRVEFLIKD